MFKVVRPKEAPAGLVQGYDSEDVVTALRKTFYKKCYLCETKNPIFVLCMSSMQFNKKQ